MLIGVVGLLFEADMVPGGEEQPKVPGSDPRCWRRVRCDTSGGVPVAVVEQVLVRFSPLRRFW